MPLKGKLPKDIKIVLEELNLLKTKQELVKKYNCTRNGLDRYLERKGYKLVQIKEWRLEKVSPSK